MTEAPFLFRRRSNQHQYQNQHTQWTKWLDTYIYMDERYINTHMQRKEAFFIFIKEGLEPFIKSHGYMFNLRHNILSELATYIYKQYARDFVRQPYFRILDHVNVDYQYYEERGIPQEDWDRFWETWGYMTDFCEDNIKNRWRVASFCYNRFDLYNSDATNKVDQEINEDYSEDDIQLNEDLMRVKDKKGLY